MAFGKVSKANEEASDALRYSKEAQQEQAALRDEVDRLRRTLRALWDITRDKLELDDDQLRERVKELQQLDRQTTPVAEKCPQCSRALQDSSDVCIYCGALVERQQMF